MFRWKNEKDGAWWCGVVELKQISWKKLSRHYTQILEAALALVELVKEGYIGMNGDYLCVLHAVTV